MPKPLTGCLGAVVLMATALLHAPAHTPAPVVVPSEASAAGSVQSTRVLQAAKAGPRLRVSAPRRISAGSRLTIRGTAPTARRGRVVVLSLKRAGSWKHVATVRTTHSGAFVFKAKGAAKAGRSQWRVTARRFGRYRSETARFTVTVTARKPGGQDAPTPEPTAGGSASDWTYITAGTSMRWDPCEAITWWYSPDRQAYPGAEQDLTRAIGMLAAQTGYTFTRVDKQGDALLTLKWATPSQEPMLKGSTIGVGGPSYQSIDPDRNHGTKAAIVSGEVTFDATETGRPGFADAAGWTWGQVFLHEVMHAMGLGHASQQVQVMYPMASTTNQHFAAGDLTGLTAVGAEKGCIDWAMNTNPSRLRTALVAE